MDSRYEQPTVDAPANVASYEAPRIEVVLTPQEIEREIFYAGTLTCPCENDPWSNIPD